MTVNTMLLKKSLLIVPEFDRFETLTFLSANPSVRLFFFFTVLDETKNGYLRRWQMPLVKYSLTWHLRMAGRQNVGAQALLSGSDSTSPSPFLHFMSDTLYRL